VSSPIVYNSLVAATLSARACLKAKSAWQWRVLTLGPEPCPSGDIRAAAEQIGPNGCLARAPSLQCGTVQVAVKQHYISNVLALMLARIHSTVCRSDMERLSGARE
jgi:hypothetical protein